MKTVDFTASRFTKQQRQNLYESALHYSFNFWVSERDIKALPKVSYIPCKKSFYEIMVKCWNNDAFWHINYRADGYYEFSVSTFPFKCEIYRINIKVFTDYAEELFKDYGIEVTEDLPS